MGWCAYCTNYPPAEQAEEGDEVRDCELCKNFTLSPMTDVCKNCGIAMLNFEKRSLTNADRIRHMSDEELAEWIRDQIIDRNIGIPSETWLAWLREEVAENE
jgi:hypothetical protein